MIGPSGAVNTMFVKRLTKIIPSLSLAETLEKPKICSVAGKIRKNTSLMTIRPFRSPHHKISDVIIVYYVVI
jgi:magnesium chelatase family protein